MKPNENRSAAPAYDVFISHRSLDKRWVESLKSNLGKQGVDVFLDWEDGATSSPANGPVLGLEQARKGVLVATAEAVQSGWVRWQYKAMLRRREKDPDFRFVPLVVGSIPIPFLDQRCVRFQGRSREAYLRAFHDLLTGLEIDPKEPTLGEDDIPKLDDIEPPAGAPEFLDDIFDTLARNPFLMLLVQADNNPLPVIEAVRERAQLRYGKNNTLHITPPNGEHEDLDRYFANLGKQCNFSEDIRSAIDWGYAMESRLKRQKVFLMITGVENGPDVGREALARELRGLGERFIRQFRLVLVGGERLVKLKYENGIHSFLNMADELSWPEPTAEDVLAWQQREFPTVEIDNATARNMLEVCGRHPQLVHYCLEKREETRDPTQDDEETLREFPYTWQLFNLADIGQRLADLKEVLNKKDLGEASSWTPDEALRRLYWNNLLKKDKNGKFNWRCDAVKQFSLDMVAWESQVVTAGGVALGITSDGL